MHPEAAGLLPLTWDAPCLPHSFPPHFGVWHSRGPMARLGSHHSPSRAWQPQNVPKQKHRGGCRDRQELVPINKG